MTTSNSRSGLVSASTASRSVPSGDAGKAELVAQPLGGRRDRDRPARRSRRDLSARQRRARLTASPWTCRRSPQERPETPADFLPRDSSAPDFAAVTASRKRLRSYGATARSVNWRSLRRCCRSGPTGRTDDMVGIKRLAQHLDISIGTVSRALNGRPDVNEETRKRVLEAARELGYVPNQSGRSLRRGVTGVIGFMMQTGHEITGAGRHVFHERVRRGADGAVAAPSRSRRAAVQLRRGRRPLSAAHGVARHCRCLCDFLDAAGRSADQLSRRARRAVRGARAQHDGRGPPLARPRFRRDGGDRDRPAGGAWAPPHRPHHSA